MLRLRKQFDFFRRMVFVKRIVSIILCMVMMLAFCGCDVDNKQFTDNTDTTPISATIKVKDYGDIKLELYPDVAPNTVANFVTLAREGFYDGRIFHRVDYGFMIQGGSSDGLGYEGSGKEIKGEFTSNGFENNLKHERGVISMARTPDPDSASSQFFIVQGEASHLDGDYAAFGKVTSGMEIVDAIASVQTNGEKPIVDVVIETITVEGGEGLVPEYIN